MILKCFRRISYTIFGYKAESRSSDSTHGLLNQALLNDFFLQGESIFSKWIYFLLFFVFVFLRLIHMNRNLIWALTCSTSSMHVLFGLSLVKKIDLCLDVDFWLDKTFSHWNWNLLCHSFEAVTLLFSSLIWGKIKIDNWFHQRNNFSVSGIFLLFCFWGPQRSSSGYGQPHMDYRRPLTHVNSVSYKAQQENQRYR